MTVNRFFELYDSNERIFQTESEIKEQGYFINDK